MGLPRPYEIYRAADSAEDDGAVVSLTETALDPCREDNVWGIAVGIAKGLQYSTRKPSACYLNFETTIL